MSALRSLWTWAALAVLVTVWLPLVALVRLFDRDPARYHTGRWFRRLGPAMTRVNPSWRVHVEGAETVTDPRRPYVVVGNHQSLADIPIVSRLPWEMKWVAKAELFKFPIVGWMMRLAGDIPVARGNQMSRARILVAAREYLNKNCSVIFFPEGTRSRDGRVLPFTDGAFRLAIKAKAPILPIALDGTTDTLPKHSWRFGPATFIRLKVLPPVETAGLKATDTEALREKVRQQIIAQVAEWRGISPAEVDAAASVAELKESANTTAEEG